SRHPHSRWYGLCPRVPCRALFPRDGGLPIGAGLTRDDLELYRRAPAGSAQVLLIVVASGSHHVRRSTSPDAELFCLDRSAGGEVNKPPLFYAICIPSGDGRRDNYDKLARRKGSTMSATEIS